MARQPSTSSDATSIPYSLEHAATAPPTVDVPNILTNLCHTNPHNRHAADVYQRKIQFPSTTLLPRNELDRKRTLLRKQAELRRKSSFWIFLRKTRPWAALAIVEAILISMLTLHRKAAVVVGAISCVLAAIITVVVAWRLWVDDNAGHQEKMLTVMIADDVFQERIERDNERNRETRWREERDLEACLIGARELPDDGVEDGRAANSDRALRGEEVGRKEHDGEGTGFGPANEARAEGQRDRKTKFGVVGLSPKAIQLVADARAYDPALERKGFQEATRRAFDFIVAEEAAAGCSKTKDLGLSGYMEKVKGKTPGISSKYDGLVREFVQDIGKVERRKEQPAQEILHHDKDSATMQINSSANRTERRVQPTKEKSSKTDMEPSLRAGYHATAANESSEEERSWIVEHRPSRAGLIKLKLGVQQKTDTDCHASPAGYSDSTPGTPQTKWGAKESQQQRDHQPPEFSRQPARLKPKLRPVVVFSAPKVSPRTPSQAALSHQQSSSSKMLAQALESKRQARKGLEQEITSPAFDRMTDAPNTAATTRLSSNATQCSKQTPMASLSTPKPLRPERPSTDAHFVGKARSPQSPSRNVSRSSEPTTRERDIHLLSSEASASSSSRLSICASTAPERESSLKMLRPPQSDVIDTDGTLRSPLGVSSQPGLEELVRTRLLTALPADGNDAPELLAASPVRSTVVPSPLLAMENPEATSSAAQPSEVDSSRPRYDVECTNRSRIGFRHSIQ